MAATLLVHLLLVVVGASAVAASLLLAALAFLVRPRAVKIPINGRRVLVTGGSSGIGLAVARQAAAQGARVAILARDLQKLEEAREEIRRATGAEVDVYGADVRDEGAVRRAVEAAGPVDVLVCSHGVLWSREVGAQDMDMEEVKHTIDVNLVGTFHLIKAALPAMKDGSLPRSITLISSQAGQLGIYGYAAYCSSKFALRGLAEALQQEVISDDIHISLVLPPDTDTPALTQEKQRRPEMTKIIASSSSTMRADEVARKTLNGIKSGRFMVSCNFMGFMLSLATSGMAPQRSCLTAFVEVASAGFVRLLALAHQHGWYNTIEKLHGKVNNI